MPANANAGETYLKDSITISPSSSALDADRYRIIFERAKIGVIFYDPDGVIQECNEKFADIIGTRQEDMLGFNILERVKNAGVLQAIRDSLQGGCGRYEGAYESISAAKKAYVRIAAYPVSCGETGDFHGVCLVEDLTEQARSEAELRKTRSILFAALEQSPAGVMIADAPDVHIRHVNRAAEEILLQARENQQEISMATPEKMTWRCFHEDGTPYMLEELPLVRTIQSGTDQQNEAMCLLRADGTKRWILVNASPIRDEAGRVIGGMIVFPDITELKESEAKNRALLSAIPDLMFLNARDGTFLAYHAVSKDQLLVSPEQFLGRRMQDIMPPDVVSRMEDAYAAAFSTRSVHQVTYELALGNEVRAYEARVIPCTEDTVFTVVRDITSQKQAEIDIRESEERFRLAALQTNQVVYDFCMGEEVFRWAGAIQSVVGDSTDREVTVPFSEWISRIHPEDRDAAVEAFRLSLATGEPFRSEYRFLHRDNRYRYIEDRGAFLRDGRGTATRLIGAMADVSERVESQRLLRESEERLELFFSQSLDGFYFMMNDEPLAWEAVADRDAVVEKLLWSARLTKVNRAFLDQYGFQDEAEVLGRPMGSFYGHDLEGARKMWREFLDVGHQHLETRETRKDGSPLWIEGDYIAMRTPDGRLAGHFGIQRDITSRKEIEQQLREAEERYRDLFLNTPDNIFWIGVRTDGTFTVESVNPAQAAALGVTPEAMAGKRIEELLPAEFSLSVILQYRKCVESGKTLNYEENVTLENGKRYFQTLLVPIRNSEGRVHRLVGFSRDITQRRQAEDALRQSQKLESLGVLAGGIAHDFNNLLTAILGNLNLAQMSISEDSPSWPYLDSMEKVVLKASELTKQMLAYSGKGRFVIKHHDLNHVVQEMTRLLQVSISKKIVLQYNLQPGLPLVEADVAQIQQVIMNLVTNASDAIGEEEGSIKIATGVRQLDDGLIATSFSGQDLEPGMFVVLEVSDTGCGMSPEVRGRIFDPFFTTKATGRGLGLSAMQGILRGHKAGITIYTEEGKGSTFRLYFPASKVTAAAQEAESRGGWLHFEGLALLVDDEPNILASSAAILRAIGFEVVTARDGVEAIEVFQRFRNRLRLVILDLTMPRMDGRQTFEVIHREVPDLAVILSSGYNEQESIREFLGKNLAGFVQKPYQIKELVYAITRALEKRPAGS